MTAKRNAVAVEVASLFEGVKRPGAFKFTTRDGYPGPAGMNFWCPCGCEALLAVSFVPPHSWKWDGNREKPTVTPSILHMEGCRWHGYLRAGVFEEC